MTLRIYTTIKCFIQMILSRKENLHSPPRPSSPRISPHRVLGDVGFIVMGETYTRSLQNNFNVKKEAEKRHLSADKIYSKDALKFCMLLTNLDVRTTILFL